MRVSQKTRYNYLYTTHDCLTVTHRCVEQGEDEQEISLRLVSVPPFSVSDLQSDLHLSQLLQQQQQQQVYDNICTDHMYGIY